MRLYQYTNMGSERLKKLMTLKEDLQDLRTEKPNSLLEDLPAFPRFENKNSSRKNSFSKDVKLKGFKDIEKELALKEEQEKIDCIEKEKISGQNIQKQVHPLGVEGQGSKVQDSNQSDNIISSIKQAMLSPRYR
jgi:hypothetical protein